MTAGKGTCKRLFFCTLILGTIVYTAGAEPFTIAARLSKHAEQPLQLTVSVDIAPGHYLYAELFKVTPADPGVTLRTVSAPAPIPKDWSSVFTGAVEFVFDVVPEISPLTVAVNFQGCNDQMCFNPQQLLLTAATGAAPSVQPADAGHGESEEHSWRELPAGFEIAATRAGYANMGDMLSFLALAAAPEGQPPQNGGAPDARRRGLGLWLLYALGIILGGIGLNLTPCVLPMIPVNIAIITAGASTRSRRHGVLLGLTYGAGIAIAYGLLGVIAVATGALFGALNASPWFNGSVAVLFFVMSLAMFGAINIDLSRFQTATDNAGFFKAGAFAAAFVLGAVSALLAGACVAPVVFSVLLFASAQYASGNGYALLLPFLLGVGMALPWPAIGGGVALLPKPGKWMEKVKYIFGLLILGLAVYYGAIAFKLAREQLGTPPDAPEDDWWLHSMPEALREAETTGKPVFIDFWAPWCKACALMDKTTFQEPAVRGALEKFVRVKINADANDSGAIKDILTRLNVKGLPTFVILRRKTAP